MTITLHSEATVDDTVVSRLDQIAKLTGGSEEAHKRLAKLDVSTISRLEQPAGRVVTSDLVRFRLLLSGMEATDVHRGGAKRTTIVEPDEPVTFRQLLAVAEKCGAARAHPGNGAASAITVRARASSFR